MSGGGARVDLTPKARGLGPGGAPDPGLSLSTAKATIFLHVVATRHIVLYYFTYHVCVYHTQMHRDERDNPSVRVSVVSLLNTVGICTHPRNWVQIENVRKQRSNSSQAEQIVKVD